MTLIGTSFSMVSAQVFHWSTQMIMLLTAPPPSPPPPHITPTPPHPPASTPNSKSSQIPNTKHRLEAQIAERLSVATMCGVTHILLLSVPFQLFSSRPESQGVNAYASKDPWKYQTIEEVLRTLHPGYFMAVVDLKSAHRSVHIKPKEHCFTGLQWWFSGDENATMMCDTRLPFGSRKSPSIFNRITQAVVRAMNCRGEWYFGLSGWLHFRRFWFP